MRAVAAVGVMLLLGLGAGYAATDTNTMPSTNRLAVTTIAVTPQTLMPAACTGTVANLVLITAATQTVATAGSLILGRNANESVSLSSGYACFVGGGPVASNADGFNGVKNAGDECILAASNSLSNSAIKNCTVVQSSP